MELSIVHDESGPLGLLDLGKHLLISVAPGTVLNVNGSDG